VVEQEALALAGHRIAGAALDVWYRYPAEAGATHPADAPFHALANVLMTPHVSGWTEGVLAARSRLIADNAARVFAGAPLLNLVP